MSNYGRDVPVADRSQREKQIVAMSDFVLGLCPWENYATLTFVWESSLDSTRRAYEKFMRQRLPGVSYFYAIERNPSRDGHHVHALWGDCGQLLRKHVWKEWFERFGRARITPIVGPRDVVDYCSKYVVKEQDTWWDLKLQSWRKSAPPFEADCLFADRIVASQPLCRGAEIVA